jgi:hypothetical protein
MGALFSKIIEIYAAEQYGPDWGVEHPGGSDARPSGATA